MDEVGVSFDDAQLWCNSVGMHGTHVCLVTREFTLTLRCDYDPSQDGKAWRPPILHPSQGEHDCRHAYEHISSKWTRLL